MKIILVLILLLLQSACQKISKGKPYIRKPHVNHPEYSEIKERIGLFFKTIRSKEWEECIQYVIVSPIQIKTLKQKARLNGITFDESYVNSELIKLLKRTYRSPPGHIISTNKNSDKNIVWGSYKHGDFDGFTAIKSSGTWYYYWD
jgi:hypothetical protein